MSELSLANIFFHMVGSVFNLFMFSLAEQKFCIWMTSHVFILSFMSLALEGVSVKILLCGISETLLPLFSSRTFMVSRPIFKYFIHLEFILVYGVGWWSSFFFLHVLFQISQHQLLKRLFFTPFFASNPFVEY